MKRFTLILSIARTHLLTKMKSTVTAALGVTFGIGAYITLVSFMTGLNQMLDNLILNQTPHIHLYNEVEPSARQPAARLEPYASDLLQIHSVKPKKGQLKIHNALPILKSLKNDARVLGASPQLRAQIFYLSGSQDLGGVLVGVDVLEEDRLSNLGDYFIEGTPEALHRSDNGIVLGAGLAEKFSLSPGDRIQVSTPDGGLFPLQIVGLYQSGLADIDNSQSFAKLQTVQQVLGQPANYITDINIKLHQLDLAVPMARELQTRFGVRARDIQEANAQFETGTSIRNLITYAVSITLLIVAGFGIYNILNMLIYEKMNDIAILKATGFSGRDVHQIFMSQALIIGFAGGAAGLLIGFVLSRIIDNLPFETEALPTITTFPVNQNPWFYLIGITFALVSTFVAGYLPAARARRIDPVRIIRGN
ncbi:ABC transporter permease [Robiginitalea sp. M366]|uniref:ABC transporter permease n=1 Tax=Robiginitalea aestuariiviva TaxID=3036903 RepID=UPI00240D55A2|nr:FtsX-like permease family protein [Robiginitalea aestuariiviva]MDG1572443.1 ABC transporter permease [Robiginitalea aestuariiviva]